MGVGGGGRTGGGREQPPLRIVPTQLILWQSGAGWGRPVDGSGYPAAQLWRLFSRAEWWNKTMQRPCNLEGSGLIALPWLDWECKRMVMKFWMLVV